MTRRGSSLVWLRVACAWLVLAVTGPRDGRAQQVPAPAPGAVQEQSLPPLEVSPRGALIRAMLVPGWGHAAIRSYTRGGFYFALEAATAYTFVRTRMRLNEARERAELRRAVVLSRMAAEGVVDPAVIQERLAADEPLQRFEDLVDSREGQQEDLIAWSIFLVFLTGADAYVSAHLSRFPTPLDMEASATPDGRAEVVLRIPFP